MATVDRFIAQEDLPPAHFNRLILLLADHHSAPIDIDIDDGASEVYTDDDDDDAAIDLEMQAAVREARKKWNAVSRGLASAVHNQVFTCNDDDQHGKTDPSKFNAEFCQECARYEVWTKAQKTPQAQKDRIVAETQAKVSGFNITRDSLSSRIDQIMEDARKNLPSIPEDAKSESSVDDEPIEVYQPPARIGAPQTEEELRIAVEMGEAEDELMQNIQKLQLEHFNRFRRWIDVPYNFLEAKPTFGKAGESKQQEISPTSNSKSQGQSPAAHARPQQTDSTADVSDMTPEDVCKWLAQLDIDEHAGKFRRTSGKVLLGMSKSDVKERFQGDLEAADILWVAIESRRPRDANNAALQHSKTGQTVKAMYDAIKQPNRSGPTMDEVRKFEEGMAHAQTRAELERGDLSAIKRTLNPGRPLRPSQQMDMNATIDSTGDEEDLSELTAKYKAMIQQDQQNDQRAGAERLSSGRGGGRGAASGARGGYGGRGGAAPTEASASASASAKVTAPPSRNRRWDIVEYSEEEDD